jgi:hypothetical protein
VTEAPRLLYHYTTAQGLLGILRSNTLWASNLNYMNDLSELKYAGNLMDSELTKAMEADPDLARHLTDASFYEIMDWYVAYALCFCEEGDQLSQWRAYAGKGTGYALGFDATRLQPKKSDYWRTLSKVVYESNEQVIAIKPSVEKYIEDLTVHLGNSSNLDEKQEQQKLADIAMRFFHVNFPNFFYFKDSAFLEEKEWRLVETRTSFDSVKDVSFREMQGAVVPYIKMTFPSSEDEKRALLPIVEIIQGPLVDPALGEKSLRMLLDKYGYDKVKIRRSRVPIRF